MESGVILRPFIKWAGGKTQLLAELRSRVPKFFTTYHEPFIGGGAMFFSLAPVKACINDINPQLVNLYCQIRNNVGELLEIIRKEDSVVCDREYYYSVRKRYNDKISRVELDVEAAALMVWCNRHCFNGLYRVNSKGFFNVPYNNKVGGSSIDRENLLRISKYLKQADINISNLDFEEACKNVKAGDFVYLDPPYAPISETADFTSYTKDGFDISDHKRVAALFRCLSDKGAYVMASNSSTFFVRDLYDGYKIEVVSAKRMINRDANKRTGEELIIRNY